MAKNFLFTSESVTEGHPDKICDQLSDNILDACLEIDPNARVACEVMCTKNKIILAGEITTTAKPKIENIVRQTIKKIGYDSEVKGLDYKTVLIDQLINEQSADISIGVDEKIFPPKELGAGDQGIMFGYACDDTENFMPMSIYCAHILANNLAIYRKKNIIDYLYPDGKTQVTVEYKDDKPFRIDTIVISAQHKSSAEQATIKKDLIQLAQDVLPKNLIDENTIFHINPTGRFSIGGPASDCGITGRKIIVDSYGGMGRHGGGSFSGKDASKVDRSATYMARYIAKNIVAAKIARKCEIQLSYAIGFHKPISINVNTFGTSKVDEQLIEKKIKLEFPLSPSWIINTLELKRPIFGKTSCYGHFGRTFDEFTWEKLDLADQLKQELLN